EKVGADETGDEPVERHRGPPGDDHHRRPESAPPVAERRGGEKGKRTDAGGESHRTSGGRGKDRQGMRSVAQDAGGRRLDGVPDRGRSGSDQGVERTGHGGELHGRERPEGEARPRNLRRKRPNASRERSDGEGERDRKRHERHGLDGAEGHAAESPGRKDDEGEESGE